MPIKKRKQKKASKGFLDAAKIADELGKKKSAPAKKTSAVKVSTVVTTSTVSGIKSSQEPAQLPKKSLVKGKSLAEINESFDSGAEIEGFDDLQAENTAGTNQVNGLPSGFIEMIGGAAIILILIEVIVIIVILLSMLFLK